MPKDLVIFLPTEGLAVSVHVFAYHHIRHLAPAQWDGLIAERAHRNPNIFSEVLGTPVSRSSKVVFAEVLFTCVTFQWQKIQLLACFFRTVLS